jgi:lysosomal Pro-X carboxypeptidase
MRAAAKWRNWQARTEMVLMTAAVRDGGVLPPALFNFTELLDEGRNYTGLPPRPYWIETEFGGFVSLGVG